jgi:hypothetical protein
MQRHLLFTVLLMLAFLCGYSQQKLVYIAYNKANPTEVFGVEQIKKAFKTQHISVAEKLTPAVLNLKVFIDHNLPKQGYSYKKQNDQYVLAGGDAVGVMYGLTELAEQISLGKYLTQISLFSGKPYIEKRGLKFNIPLDARTPSYADSGFAAQHNIATMWEFSFWKNFLDNMARYRYNVLSLWNLHQFPSMVKVPEYPDVALNDVYVRDDVHSGAKLHSVKKISIDEKIRYWKKVFKYANERGIDIQWYNWSVFVSGAEGKDGIKWAQDDRVTIDYTRKSIKQFLLTYPNIKALGVTAGEHLDTKQTGQYSIENWLALTYGKGIMDAKAINPDLDVSLIFRQHYTRLDIIKAAFKDYTGPFETEFKYARARMYATVNPPWFDSIYRADVVKYNVKCWQNIRNDDTFIYRWGDPVFAAQFIKNIPLDVTAGFVMGDDGYMYGKDFASKNPAVYGEYEIDKNWYNFMIWGRAAYDPDLPEQFYKDQLQLHFPNTDVNTIYTTWHATSAIVSWIDKLCFKPNDYEFDLEGCFNKQGFFDINSLISSGPLPGQNVISIVDYVKQQGKTDQLSPFDVADKLDAAAAILLKGSNTISTKNNPELAETVTDFKAWAYLGRYYAEKFRGATWTAMLRNTGDEDYRKKAILALSGALVEWKKYAAVSTEKYRPQLFSRTGGTLDWNALIPGVEKDIEIAKNAKMGEAVKQKTDNKLWKITSKYY